MGHRWRGALCSLAAVSVLAGAAAAETFQIDPNHSSVNFRIRHIVGKVRGHFDRFEGTFDYAPGKPKVWKASATIETASVNTGVDKREAHLRTAEFFDVEKCPALRFVGDKITDVKKDAAKLQGDLTLHCVTRPVMLDVEIGGVTKDPWGNQRAGFTATGRINRKDFGMVWNKTLDAGGVMLGDDVEISLEIEGIVPQAPEKAK